MGQDKDKINIHAEIMKMQLVEDRLKFAESSREEMEILGTKIRALVLSQPPVQLLGYLLSQFHIAIMQCSADPESGHLPAKDTVETYQFALEYVHAVWSSHSPLLSEQTSFAQNTAEEIMSTLSQLSEKTIFYCLASSQSEAEFLAKCTWATIRGHRYQVLEEEFFLFVLEPHDAALQQAYGMSFSEIASEIQSIADAFRTGFSSAANKLAAHLDHIAQRMEKVEGDFGTIVERLKVEDNNFINESTEIFQDIFLGGTCNLNRHTKLSQQILEDLSYEPGQNNDFFADGLFVGTPMRTLPARIKPGIKLGSEFYVTDGQFVRDSAYRAIQWGLWRRLPYRAEWLTRQARVVEQAYPRIFSEQLKGARCLESIYYQDAKSGHWVETDLLIIIADVLFVIEAKAGAMPMHSPATNFASHKRVIQDLIVKAY